ncbi:hypothetical protein IscW_ISCW003943 [Ixodes scapularis]|uniref:Uncharacterized protein n=1 Tax=Ixodes scapularis TaxID=6945 RepID=B7PIE5_IXOSC|nr:hypothetical protein IscW_ISCW003943 [Ixodes scapularis]|eukprot:XP_002404891.1 hypothetical protein IscW_ISCW003943 [Ixodes scapularis]
MSCLQQRNVPNASEMFAQMFRVIADHVLDFFFNSLTVDRSLVEAALHGMSNQDCDAAYPDCHLP